MSEAVFTGQGTRLEEMPPWMSYAEELKEDLPPQLEKAVAEYAERRYDSDQTSSQNKEELARQKELNDELAEQYQWVSPEEYEEVAPRIGRVMHSSVFITKLRSLTAKSGIKYFYRDHPQPDKVTLVYSRHGTEPLEVACWVQHGFMPEYSIMRFDSHGVPLDERRRGWRTCLLQLILKGLITEEQANKTFGEALGPASVRYLQTLQDFRNRNTWE